MSNILIVGATGLIGAHLVNTLADNPDHRVIAATRDPSGAHARPNVERRRLDLRDSSTYPKAIEGVQRAFVLAPTGHSDAVGLVGPLLDALVEGGAEHVVLMTANGVQFDDNLPLRRLELHLEASGVSHTILRPGWFMQNFQTFWSEGIKREDTIWVPAADGLTAFVDTRDIAEAAAAALEGKVQGAYNLTGPQALTYGQAAQALSEAVGRPLSYEHAEPEAFGARLSEMGMDEGYVRTMDFLFQSVRDGFAAPISHDVEALTGKTPRTLETYARDHAHLL